MPFRINTPDVSHELVDGEVIVVHSATGAYYSLSSSAAVIWGWLDRGMPLEDMANKIAELNGEPRESCLAVLRGFSTELEAEGLITPLTSVPDGHAVLAGNDGAGLIPFEPPRFEKYSDMEELLLVDPIHEVSSHGWPEKPAALN